MALGAITAYLVLFRWQSGQHPGITTEIAAVATYCIAVLAATPGEIAGARLAVGAAIVVVALLEAKRSLHKLVRETITDTEFNDTIWFLAIIFIIYPLLPAGDFGPYGSFSPRKVWVFVILVSSISYVGYFLQKFLGARRGLTWTSVLGGVASTTACTLAFARQSREETEKIATYWYAVVVANAVQFPRVLVILAVVNAELARRLSIVLLAMMAAGLLAGWFLYRRSSTEIEGRHPVAGNPFRLAPALKFGAVFAAIMFVSKAAAVEFGGQGVYWASAAGGTVDADAVSVSVASLLAGGTISAVTAELVLLLALLMNAVLKTILAAYAGGRSFGWRVASGFAVMFGAGAAIMFLPGTF